MQRDGQTTSLWQTAFPDYEPQNAASLETLYDVIIVGGGITGITTGLLLQEQGKKCLIAEAHNVGFGTTGGTTAHLNTMLDSPYSQIIKDFGEENARLVCDGCRQAISFIEQRSEQHNIDSGFSHQTGYLFAENDKEAKELEEIFEGAQKAGAKVRWSDIIPLPTSFIKAAAFEEEAQMHSTRYLYGLAKAFESAGGVILQHCMVQGVEHKEEVFTLNSTLGGLRSKALVYATHLPQGINILHFRCAPYRSYAAAFTLKEGIYPDGLAYDLKDPYHYFRTQEVDGKQYVIAGGFDHKTGHETNTDAVFRELEAYLRGLYDIDEYAYQWSSQYYTTPDGLPYIGLLPGQNDTYCATGYSGNGLTLGTLAGIVLRDIITGKETPYEALFKPSRVKPVAGFMEFIKENADVVSQFIGKRFKYEKISELAELAPGEAKLAEWEGKKVALYKDENGKVHAVDPVCPHAKCIVDWNSAEKSWDCPCHGARYAPNGALLTGPARHGLTPLLWEDFEGD